MLQTQDKKESSQITDSVSGASITDKADLPPSRQQRPSFAKEEWIVSLALLVGGAITAVLYWVATEFSAAAQMTAYVGLGCWLAISLVVLIRICRR
jgi:hypothetical protein